MKQENRFGSGRELIIDLSDSRSVWICILEDVATVGMWSLWLYLMLPFIGILLSWSRLPTGYGFWIAVAEQRELFAFLGFCAGMFASIILGVMGWGYGNYLAFLHRGRTPARPPVPDREFARSLGVDVSELDGWRQAKTLVVGHDDRGRIQDVIRLPQVPRDLQAGRWLAGTSRPTFRPGAAIQLRLPQGPATPGPGRTMPVLDRQPQAVGAVAPANAGDRSLPPASVLVHRPPRGLPGPSGSIIVRTPGIHKVQPSRRWLEHP